MNGLGVGRIVSDGLRALIHVDMLMSLSRASLTLHPRRPVRTKTKMEEKGKGLITS